MNAYLITNLVNGKRYVGISREPEIRWQWHLQAVGRNVDFPLYRAIAKYGQENFTFELVACAKTWADLCETERALIAQYNTYGSRGYNGTRGGEGVLGRIQSEEERAHRSAIMKGNTNGQKTGDMWRGKTNPHLHGPEARAKTSAKMKGRKRSEAECAAISKGKTGKKISEAGRLSLKAARNRPEVRAQLSASLMGHSVSKKTKAKISAANTGKRHTDEAKAKMSKTRSGRKLGPCSAEGLANIRNGQARRRERERLQKLCQMKEAA